MRTRNTLTIGIPAYNEEANIVKLLSSLSTQKTTTFSLEHVIVASDGSTDRTVDLARSFHKLPMHVIALRKRQGKAFVLNTIIKKTSSDALVLLDADTTILDVDFLEKLLAPIFSKKADLTSAKVAELPPQNLFGRVLQSSMQMKKNMFEELNGGNNLFTCHGRSRGLSRNLYTHLRFHNSAGEDAYSYLYANMHGYAYTYVSSTSIYYQLPLNWEDHRRQSVRYLQHSQQFLGEFSQQFIAKNYRLPLSLVCKHLVLQCARTPVRMGIYLLILTALKVESIRQKAVLHTWEISPTSKKVDGHTHRQVSRKIVAPTLKGSI